MSGDYEVAETLDVRGESCPIPVVKTKQTIDSLTDGSVLEVAATDRGSLSDIEGWATTTDGVELLGQEEVEENGEMVYKHWVRRTEG